jgi:hypothetical protein
MIRHTLAIKQGGSAVLDQYRAKRFLSLGDRLALYAKKVRQRAARLPPGVEKDALLKKAHQANSASELHDRAGSLGPQSPG